MPKTLLLALLFLTVSTLMAQNILVRGEVTDAGTGEPLAFVNISAEASQNGTSTDIDGRFQIKLKPGESQDLHFSYIGYEKKSVMVNPDENALLEVSLKEKTDQLQEVTVLPGTNPAHRIIKNAVAHRKENNPENLPAFSYKTYSKFVATVNTDSVDPKIDTVFHPVIQDSIVKIDSGNYKMVKFMERQHLFFMENVTERKYIQGKRDNETVLATKTSGFKNPLFALLSTELQSFSFYSDHISIAGEDFLNPLTPGSTGRYFFLMQDTAYNSPTDTVFIISFRPQPNYGFKPLQGLLYINSSDWAVQNVIARPVEPQGTQVEIEQKYTRYGEHTWFPEQLNANLLFNTIEINKATPEARMRTYLSDIEIGSELQKKDISRARVTIADEAVQDAPQLLEQYRVDSLNLRENFTYTFMDSLSEAENLERKLDILVTLMRGKLPLGPVDIDLKHLLRYNRYEGLRPGLGLHTNDRFSKWFTIGGYTGYGFGDELWKYGFDTRVSLHKHSNLALLGGYQFDIFETGGTNFIQKENRSLLEDYYRLLFIKQWDETERSFAGFTYDPLVNLQLKVLARHEERNVVGDYTFQRPGCDNCPGNRFDFFEVITALRFAPEEEFVEGPGFGKLQLTPAYPVFYLQYTRGLRDVWESEFEYNKIDLRIEHQIKDIFVGTSSISLQSGAVLEDIPYSKLYVGAAHLIDHDDFSKRMRMVADRNSFETMRFNEFVSDRYVQLMYRQDFKSLLFRRENFAPHIELVARALWGGLRQRGLHENVDFRAPEKGYYEAGLELNKLLTPNFFGIGVGFYYRLGAYSFPQFEENFAVKLTSKFSF